MNRVYVLYSKANEAQEKCNFIGIFKTLNESNGFLETFRKKYPRSELFLYITSISSNTIQYKKLQLMLNDMEIQLD